MVGDYAHPMEVRRPREADFAQVLALVQAYDRAVFGDTDWTAAELRELWDDLDLDRDAWLVELDGRPAGVMHLCERRGAVFVSDGYVHPECRSRGVGSLLLELVEERAVERIREAPRGERVMLRNAYLHGDPSAPALLERMGFARARAFFRMVTSSLDDAHEPSWPDGVEVAPFDVGAHGRLLHAATQVAFAEEWGHTPTPYDDWAAHALDRTGFEPELVVVAWSGDELVGFSLNYPKRMGDWGWIGALGVAPSWRRRGLGLALLYESFRRFREIGETVVALGVDSENPTGATRLYERAGMRVLWRADVWEKELAAAESRR
jgi:mycothiol synthase